MTISKVAITGSIAFDYLMRYPGEFKEMLIAEKLDQISVSFLVDELSKHRGGVAPNIAYTMALLGENPLLVGSAGKDFGEYRDFLESTGVDTSATISHDDLFTASFFANTDNSNNQIASFYTGAMARAKLINLKESLTEGIDLVVISPNDPEAMDNYVAECKSLGMPYMYDAGQQVARMSGESLAKGLDGAHILIVNEYEHTALCQKTDHSPDDLLAKADIVIITRGENGADIYANGKTIHIPIFPPTEIKDPTGAGDAFRSGLLKGLIGGLSWELSGRIGALAASYALEQMGTQTHHYTPQEFIDRFRTHFDDQGQLDAAF